MIQRSATLVCGAVFVASLLACMGETGVPLTGVWQGSCDAVSGSAAVELRLVDPSVASSLGQDWVRYTAVIDGAGGVADFCVAPDHCVADWGDYGHHYLYVTNNTRTVVYEGLVDENAEVYEGDCVLSDGTHGRFRFEYVASE